MFHSFSALALEVDAALALSVIWQSIRNTPIFSLPSGLLGLATGRPNLGSSAAVRLVEAPAPWVRNENMPALCIDSMASLVSAAASRDNSVLMTPGWRA